jgi:hypothetical protein
MPIEWEPQLHQRQGSRQRLGGLDVYYDFDWRTVFRHNRSTFPNGQSLAKLVADECPAGKIPTLLLTSRQDVEASIRTTDDRHIVIVPINDYLTRSGFDAASTYYARLAGGRLTQISALAQAEIAPEDLSNFLAHQLDAAALSSWAGLTPENRATLVAVAAAVPNAAVAASDLIRHLGALEPEDIRSLVERVRIQGPDAIGHLLSVATESPDGRGVASSILGGRIEDRISDARRQLIEYRQLIQQAGVTETQVQRFLEEHPWIVGLAYVRARPRVEVPRGSLDFVLDRYDGFFDFLELKGPEEQIIVAPVEGIGRPAPASAYSLGPGLAKALAQAHLYRANLAESAGLAQQYGLSDTRQPRIMIVLGRSTDLTPTTNEILRQLNLSLHRVEVIPYDVFAERSEGWLTSIESLLARRLGAVEAADERLPEPPVAV